MIEHIVLLIIIISILFNELKPVQFFLRVVIGTPLFIVITSFELYIGLLYWCSTGKWNLKESDNLTQRLANLWVK